MAVLLIRTVLIPSGFGGGGGGTIGTAGEAADEAYGCREPTGDGAMAACAATSAYEPRGQDPTVAAAPIRTVLIPSGFGGGGGGTIGTAGEAADEACGCREPTGDGAMAACAATSAYEPRGQRPAMAAAPILRGGELVMVSAAPEAAAAD